MDDGELSANGPGQSSGAQSGSSLNGLAPVVSLASRRLQLLLWASLVAGLFGLLVRLGRLPTEGAELADKLGVGAMLVIAILSAGMLLTFGQRRRIDSRDIRLSLVFEVLLGWVLALSDILEQALRHGYAPNLTW